MKLATVAVFWSLILSPYAQAKRILILSADGGHRPSALGVAGALKRIDRNLQVDIVDMLDDQPKAVESFFFIVRTSEVLSYLGHKLFAYLLKGVNSLNLAIIPINSTKYIENKEFLSKYDLVLLNYAPMQQVSSAVCRELGIPFMVIPPDLGEPCRDFWIRRSPDTIYLLGSKYLRQSASDHPNVAPISGMVLRPEFRHIRDTSKRDMKIRLGLDPDKKMVLVLFGSAGSDAMLDIAKIVQKDKSRQYIFICASYKELKTKIDELKQSHFKAEGYINNVHEYMRAADVFIGKPGPGCVSECIQCETPVILKYSLPWETMPQEVPTIWYVKENKLGIVIKRYSDILQAINQLILNPPSHFPHNNAADQCATTIVHILRNREKVKSRLYQFRSQPQRQLLQARESGLNYFHLPLHLPKLT